MMKHSLLVLSLLSVIVLAGCTKAPTATNDTGAVVETGAVADTGSTDTGAMADTGTVDTGTVADTGSTDTGAMADEVKTITVVAKKWEYTPSTITVKKGDKVKLVIENADMNHGIKFTNMTVTEVESGVMLDTSTAGSFEFFCPTFCGEGHKDMKGTVVVTE